MNERAPGPIALRRLIPAVLVLGLVLDVGSRFLPYDAVAFRGWEALSADPFVTQAWEVLTKKPPSLLASFRPNERYVNDRAYGDLAPMGNRPWLRQYHREVVTTDSLGLRNTAPPGAPHVALVAGTSFTFGSTMSDDETLPAQLSALLGGGVYNAGASDDDDFHVDALLDRVNVAPGGTYILEHLERNDPPTIGNPNAGRMVARLRRTFGDRYLDLRMAYAEMNHWLDVSPLRVMLVRARKLVENDVVLPNSFAPFADLETLKNGDPMLFLPLDKTQDESPQRPADLGIPYWRHLADHLERRGLHFLVVLVPTKYTVYGPLTMSPPAALTGPRYLAEMSAALQAAGIANLDVTASLQSAARVGLPDHRYIYWRDDSHWNKDAVALVAESIAARMKALGWTPASSAAPPAR
ncbi:MAG TPA: hypothetical protein VH560_18325 [Polyangia bacterium]|jgi:hypothetical protein|nr:hypothetical protein [Polyangia bacterium]